MKKLTLFLSAMLLACATNLWAEEATLTFSSTTSTSAVTVEPISFVFTNGSTNTKWYDADGMRFYEGATIKISSEKTITNIVFTHTISNNGVLSLTKGDGSYNTTNKTWTGSTDTVTFKVTHSTGTKNGQVRMTKIVVSYKDGTTSSVVAPVFEVPEGAVQANGSFSAAFDLTISCATSGASIFYTIDGTDPAESSTALKYTAPIAISKSTVVRAIAKDGDANLSNERYATYCYINSEATAYTTTEAIAIIDGGLGLDNELYVKGTISEVTSFNSDYGSLTYTITDGTNPFVIYRGLDIDGAKFTGTNNLNVGDEVVVKGIMKKYKETYEMDKNNQLVSRVVVKTPLIEADDVLFGNIFSTGKTKELVVAGYNLTDAITYTLSEDAAFTVDGTLTAEGGTLTITFTGTTNGTYSATLTLTSGTVTLPVAISATLMSLTGEGTKENPFTVEDVIAINSSLGKSQKYWVIGYILGSYANGGTIASPAVNSNLALGGTADATTFIPVELPSSTVEGGARATLNVADHKDNIGKQVKVCGTLEAYFTVAGVKNVKTADEYEIMSTPTAITNTTLNAETIKTIENGQLIIIRDGKKYNAMGVRLQ